MSALDSESQQALDLLSGILRSAPGEDEEAIGLEERLEFQRTLAGDSDGAGGAALLATWVRDHAY